MALPDRQTQAVIAANRFGLGARGDDIRSAAGDPRGWLEQQLDAPPVIDGQPSGQALLAEYYRLAKVQSAARKQQSAGAPPMEGQTRVAADYAQERYQNDVLARTRAAVDASASLPHRLAWFWSNHFTVSVAAVAPVIPIAGAFEREAIRPNVFGTFGAMLLASTRHPAMLLYLDNVSSVGPDSPVGQRSRRGLNENLGREVLELHTLGVNGGYTQKDVTTFAKALTGWSVNRDTDGAPADGSYMFDPSTHEPGGKTILGRTYAQDGEDQVTAVLADLARHPATARHVATKLARHFIADDPPEAAIARLTRTFLDTGGDLREVTRALIRLDEPWQQAATKIKSPNELVVSALRGLEQDPPEAGPLISALSVMGQRPYSAPAPTGWPDTADDWASPYAISKRIEWAARLGGAAGAAAAEPEALARAMLGDSASGLLIESIRRASSRTQALALLLASPSFQRR